MNSLLQVPFSSPLACITTQMWSLLLHPHSVSHLPGPVEDTGMLGASATAKTMYLFTLKTIFIPNSSEENLNFLLTDSTYRFYQLPNLASSRRQNLGRTNPVLFLFFSVKWQAYIQLSDKWVFETAMHCTKMSLDTQF